VLADVRFGAYYGLTLHLARGPKIANTETGRSAPPKVRFSAHVRHPELQPLIPKGVIRSALAGMFDSALLIVWQTRSGAVGRKVAFALILPIAGSVPFFTRSPAVKW
jgi:hypothetical protein